MSRAAIELLLRQFEAAYRGDYFHGLRKNLLSVQPEEWDIRPADHSVEVFGTRPELTIHDIATHVGGALIMYTNRAFGSADLQWGDIAGIEGQSMKAVIAWLDECHDRFAAGLSALTDDDELQAQRPAPWDQPLRRMDYVTMMTNHQVYHSGEVNRQRALIRGSSGWERES